MSFIDIDSDIQRIKHIVDRWHQSEVNELERELVLEKLRAMYEKILSFEKKQPVPQRASGLGKSAIMSLYGVPTNESSCEPIHQAEPKVEPVYMQIPDPVVAYNPVIRSDAEENTLQEEFIASADGTSIAPDVVQKAEPENFSDILADIDNQLKSNVLESFVDRISESIAESEGNSEKEAVVIVENNLFAQIDNVVVQTTLNLYGQVMSSPAPSVAATSTVVPKKVLGEVAQEGSAGVLNDMIGRKSTKMDLSTKIQNNKITDLRQGIGLNDRFLLIKDIFGGDPVLYDKTIEELNKFEDFDQAMIYIYENYSGDPDSPAVKLLVDLLSYKLS